MPSIRAAFVVSGAVGCNRNFGALIDGASLWNNVSDFTQCLERVKFWAPRRYMDAMNRTHVRCLLALILGVPAPSGVAMLNQTPRRSLIW